MIKHCLGLRLFYNFWDSISPLILGTLLTSILFFGCASTQDLVLTNRKILDQAEKAKNIKRTVKELKKKDSIFEDELQDLVTRLVDLDTQLKYIQDQISALEAKLEDYRQLLDRSLSDTFIDNDNTRMDLERMENAIKKLSEEMEAIKNAQMIESSKSTYNMEDLNEESFYDLAYITFKQGKFDKAHDQFNSFLKRFPKGKFSDNARFWIGECYYRKNQYEEAILEYEKVKNEYPSGDKVPSALFKQALSFLKLDKKEEASIIFEDLIRHYPQSEQAEMAKKKLDRLR